MTAPANPWSDNTLVNAAMLYSQVTVPIAALTLDTGLVTVTGLASGWTQDSTPLQVRRLGPVVYVIGGLFNSGFSSSSFTTVATIPGMTPSIRPVTSIVGTIGGTTGANRTYRILIDGSVQVATSAATSASYRLDTCCYLVG